MFKCLFRLVRLCACVNSVVVLRSFIIINDSVDVDCLIAGLSLLFCGW